MSLTFEPAGVLNAGSSRLRLQRLADYWTLTKPEVNFLIAITTGAGFCLALPVHARPFPFVLLIHTLLGTVLIAGGTGTLNQFIERHWDALMRRTARRPLPAGRIKPWHALCFGILLSLAGAIYLALRVNWLASVLAILTILSYLFVYTPLKRRSPLCVLVGACSGATPPLIGWAAGSGSLAPQAWVLYLLLLLWQLPHVMAIAWMYREDYARAGYVVLPSSERREAFMIGCSVLPVLALIPLSIPPMPLNHFSFAVVLGALLLDLGFCYVAVQFALNRNNIMARRLLLASVLYLPLLLALMVGGKMI